MTHPAHHSPELPDSRPEESVPADLPFGGAYEGESDTPQIELGGGLRGHKLTPEEQLALGRIGWGGAKARAAVARANSQEEDNRKYGKMTGPLSPTDEERESLTSALSAIRRQMAPAVYDRLVERATRPDGTVNPRVVLSLARNKQNRRSSNRRRAA